MTSASRASRYVWGSDDVEFEDGETFEASELFAFHLKGKHNQKTHGGNAKHIPDVTDTVTVAGTGQSATAIEYVDYKSEQWLKLDAKIKNKLWHKADDLTVIAKGAGIGAQLDEMTLHDSDIVVDPKPAVDWVTVVTGGKLEVGQAIKTPNGVGSFNKTTYDKDGYWVHADVPGVKKKWYKVAEVQAAIAEGKGVKFGDHDEAAPKVPTITTHPTGKFGVGDDIKIGLTAVAKVTKINDDGSFDVQYSDGSIKTQAAHWAGNVTKVVSSTAPATISAATLASSSITSPDVVNGITVKKWASNPNLVQPDDQMISTKNAGTLIGNLHPKALETHAAMLAQGYSHVGTAASNDVYAHPTKSTLLVSQTMGTIAEIKPGIPLVDQNWQPVTPKATAATASTKSVPTSLSGLTKGGSLGGGSGSQATMYTDADGQKYVVKKSDKGSEHMQSEFDAGLAYKAAGVAVPDAKIIEGGTTQIAKFVEGKTLGQLKGAEYEAAAAKIRENFVLDAVLGNRDVIGPKKDNVLIDADGKVWRIDNGGALGFTGFGLPKEFGPKATEVDSMLDPKYQQLHSVFGKITPQELHNQALALQSKKQAIIDALPEKYKGIVAARIDDAVEKTSQKLSSTGSVIPASTMKFDPNDPADSGLIATTSNVGKPTGKVDKNMLPLNIGDKVVHTNSGNEIEITHVTPEGFVKGKILKIGANTSMFEGDETIVFTHAVEKISSTTSAPASTGPTLGGWKVGDKFQATPGSEPFEVVGINTSTGKVKIKSLSAHDELEYTPAQLGSAGFKPPSGSTTTSVPATKTSITGNDGATVIVGDKVKASPYSNNVLTIDKIDDNGIIHYTDSDGYTGSTGMNGLPYGVKVSAGTSISSSIPSSALPSVSASIASPPKFPSEGEDFQVPGKGKGSVTKVQPGWVKIEGIGKKKWYTTAEVNEMLGNAPTVISVGGPNKYHMTQVGKAPSSTALYSKTAYNDPNWKPWVSTWKSQLTSAEKSSISSYKGGSYDVNAPLRKNQPLTASALAKLQNLDTAIAKSIVPFDMTVTRRVDAGVWDHLQVGDTWRDKGYVGTSTSPNIMALMMWRATIHVPKGSHGAYIEELNDYKEYELLLPRGSHFRVLKKSHNTIELELIGD